MTRPFSKNKISQLLKLTNPQQYKKAGRFKLDDSFLIIQYLESTLITKEDKNSQPVITLSLKKGEEVVNLAFYHNDLDTVYQRKSTALYQKINPEEIPLSKNIIAILEILKKQEFEKITVQRKQQAKEVIQCQSSSQDQISKIEILYSLLQEGKIECILDNHSKTLFLDGSIITQKNEDSFILQNNRSKDGELLSTAKLIARLKNDKLISRLDLSPLITPSQTPTPSSTATAPAQSLQTPDKKTPRQP